MESDVAVVMAAVMVAKMVPNVSTRKSNINHLVFVELMRPKLRTTEDYLNEINYKSERTYHPYL